MADIQSFQAPLEVGGYVNQNIDPIPSQPIASPQDLYSMFGVKPVGKTAAKVKSPYEDLMDGNDPFRFTMPSVRPLQTAMTAIDPLKHEDGYAKYGYSSILGEGDNEARYADNFRRDNPSLFFQEGFHPIDGIKKAIYWGGGFLEKTLESAAIKVGQGFAGLYGLTIGNTIGAIQGEQFDGMQGWLAKSSDNVFSNVLQGWDENLKERYHYFQEKNDRDRKGFIESLGDGDFWMNDISDGLAFLASAGFQTGIIGKLGLGTKVATRLAPLAEGVSTSALAAGASQAGKLAQLAKFVGAEASGSALIKNAVDLTSQTLAVTAIESMVEADETRKGIYNSLSGKINPETGFIYSKNEMDQLSAAGAAEVFKHNMVTLIGPKFLETLVFNKIGKAFKMRNVASMEGQGAASSALGSRAGGLMQGLQYNKPSNLRRLLDVGKLAGVGFISEGLFEENLQLAISRQATQAFGAESEFYRPLANDKNVDMLGKQTELFGNVKDRYFEQLKSFGRGITDSRYIDDELSKSIGIGGAFGVGGGIIAGTLNISKQAKIDNYWKNRINGQTKSLVEAGNFFKTETKTVPDPADPTKSKTVTTTVTDPTTGKPVVDEAKVAAYLDKMNNIEGIMDVIKNTEDPTNEDTKDTSVQELNKLARNVLFSNLAIEYIKAGKKDLLIASLKANEKFTDADISALGYDPARMDDKEKQALAGKMIAMTDRIDKAYQWIENNVLDNVSEERKGFAGLSYTKAQKAKRQEFFSKKKEYLLHLSRQNALLDSYADDINAANAALGTMPEGEVFSSVLDENQSQVADFQVNLDTLFRSANTRIPAITSMMDVLERKFAYHWDNVQALKTAQFHQKNSTIDTTEEEMMAKETLDRLNDLEKELDELKTERDKFLKTNEAYEVFEEDGNTFIRMKKRQDSPFEESLQQISDDKARRINGVKLEEIAIQKDWISNEWKQTAALKEEKTKQDRKDTRFSRRMSGSKNAYNEYYQREVVNRDDSEGIVRMELWNKDETKRVTAKKYKANEEKLLKSVRIRGKVLSIISKANGTKLLAEIEELVAQDLNSQEFARKAEAIINQYKGVPTVVTKSERSPLQDQIDYLEDEIAFAQNLLEFAPEDDRFNEKYYDTNAQGGYDIKQEYDSIPAMGVVVADLNQRLANLTNLKTFLGQIPTEVNEDWTNLNMVKKIITKPYTDTADNIISNYNSLSNNGQSEVSGDSLSSKQDLDLIEYEINELGQLKEIFIERDQTDNILSAPEFDNFIPDIEERIAQLEKIRKVVTERMSSRLKENQNFLVDTVESIVNEVGYKFDGTISTPPLQEAYEAIVGGEAIGKLSTSLNELNTLINKQDRTAEDNNQIDKAYWSINGQVAAIQEIAKAKDPQKLKDVLEGERTRLTGTLSNDPVVSGVPADVRSAFNQNIGDSVLGSLQTLFYSAPFSRVGRPNDNPNFLDDKPTSPIYKFREDYNLRKLVRNVERDNSRTPENTDFSKEALMQFLPTILQLQVIENSLKKLDSSLNMLDQIEREKEIVQAAKAAKDNSYEGLIIPSIQQLMFIRNISNFIRRNTISGSQAIDPINSMAPKTGVIDVFSQHPNLSKIGTAQQYSAYLAGIFPNSWHTEIVYRGVGEVREDNLREGTKGKEIRDWNFFTNSRKTAEDYGDNITMALLNMQSLDNAEELVYKNSGFINEDSAFVAGQGGDEYVVRSKSQVHILGSEADAKRFQEWMNKRKTVSSEPKIGFRNWTFIQAPGGAGKTQSLGTWFNRISGIPSDRVMATAFTKEAAKGIQKALRIDNGLVDIDETIAAINENTKNGNFEYDVLVVDEFPAISISKQKDLFNAVTAYTKAKLAQGKGEFKVITLGDTNQLTFDSQGTVIPHSSIITNPDSFQEKGTKENDNHIGKMNIIPSLTVNFRSNLFPITFFIDQFKGSGESNINAATKVMSTDRNLETAEVKGVVSVDKGSFLNKMISYINLNQPSNRTRALIVNESKIPMYKKAMQDAGIAVIDDPNNELTKGIYITSVQNSQGFSFDEVFIDVESVDKDLFSSKSNLDYVYNKTMYVAASRARNLIVVTNFPNFENIVDSNISALENKALSELQTKDDDFLNDRDLEIEAAKSILGNEYSKAVKSAAPIKAEPVVETPMDNEPEPEVGQEEDDEAAEEVEEETNEPIKTEEDEDENSEEPNEVEPASGEEGIIEEVSEEKSFGDHAKEIADKIKDKTVAAFDKVKESIINLLFPSTSTLRYRLADGVFRNKAPEGYENPPLRDGDTVSVVPFQQSKNSKSSRKFGYAVVTPTKDSNDQIIPDQFRIVAIFSDHELDNMLSKSPELAQAIKENEKRDKGFVSTLYDDIKNVNGVTLTGDQSILDGSVVHANPIKYFFGKTYRQMDATEMSNLITNFINQFYKNHLDSFPAAQRPTELQKLKDFYKLPQNAQIIIPTQEDITKNRFGTPKDWGFNIAGNLGRPFLMMKPFHAKSAPQFIPLSRKMLNSKIHGEYTQPIREFISQAKLVKAMLAKKGIEGEIGYSKSISSLLSRVSNDFARNKSPEGNVYKTTVYKKDSKETVEFSLVEAERIYNLWQMYQVTNLNQSVADKPQDIEKLVKSKKRRNYIFEDGETVYGSIISYDKDTNSYVVKDARTDEELQKTGAVKYNSKSNIGPVQQALNQIFNSNGTVAKQNTSGRTGTGFVTDKGNVIGAKSSGYTFMALLGSKTAAVAKAYNEKGEPTEYYEDVIEILEDLFNFDNKGVNQGKFQLRVPVKINSKKEDGTKDYDYSYSSANTSRQSDINNLKFFESNLDAISPTQAMITFEQPQQGTPIVVEEPIERQVPTSTVEVSSKPMSKGVTPQTIKGMTFAEIDQNLSPEQRQRLETEFKDEYGSLAAFFNDASSQLPADQNILKDYLIDCLL